MRVHWLTIGAVSMGFATLAPLNIASATSNSSATIHTVANQSGERARRTSVDYDELPGAVRQTVGQHLGQHDTVEAVTRVERPNGKTTYVVHVTSSQDRARNLYVDESGKLLDTKDVTKAGQRRVKINDLPGPVQNTLRHEAGNEGFKRITQVTDEGQTWYVAQLNDGRTLRVDSSGNVVQHPKMLSERGRDPNQWEEGGIERQVVPFNTLPGAVQGTVNRMRGQERATQAVKITRGNETYYRVRLEGPNNRVRMVRVDQNGKLLDEWNATEPGRTEVRLDTLPGPVKGAILHNANGEKIEQITQVTRGQNTWYVAEIQDRSGHIRVLRVDSSGNVIQPQPRNR